MLDWVIDRFGGERGKNQNFYKRYFRNYRNTSFKYSQILFGLIRDIQKLSISGKLLNKYVFE
jgi:hypothetical protein